VKGKSQYYGIPAELNIGWGANILINRDAFNEVGVSEKSWGDWAAFISDMQKLTIKDSSGNLTRSGLEVVVGSWAHVWVGTYHALGQGEVRDFNPDGTSAWDSDFGREVLQIVDNYVNKWKIASVDLADIVCLGNNKAAAQQQGPWVTAMYDADFPDLNWEYVRIPNLPGTKKKDPYYAGGLGGWAWFVSEASKNKGAAWEFLKFRADPENAIQFNLETRTVPARRKTAADPRISEHPAYKEWIPVLPYQVAVDNYGVGAEEIRKNITDMVMSVGLKEATVDEAITTAAKNVNEIRARYKEIKS
jgi:ABC-type glycerol-3-phosphate transport system substrate-binding protein